MDSDFLSYFKIVDTVMLLGSNTSLRMNVTLNYKGSKGEMRSFHQEYTTYDSKINSTKISIQRYYNYYLSLENYTNSNKEFIIIGSAELYKLKRVLPMLSDWFESPEYAGLFAINGNKELYLDKQVDAIMLDLPMQKFISFEPVAINYQNLTSAPGVRMYLNSANNYIDIPWESRFIGFIDIIQNFDLYLAAQNLLNYLQRPAFGTNNNNFQR